jgi:hypothetical protein
MLVVETVATDGNFKNLSLSFETALHYFSDYTLCCTIRFSNSDNGKRFFSCPKSPDGFWGPINFVFIVPGDKAA